MRIVILSIIALAIMVGCSSSKKTNVKLTEDEYIIRVINEEFKGDPAERIYNQDRDFVIVINRLERGVGYPVVANFVVIDVDKQKVLYTESVLDGDVSWIDNDNVLIKRVPEVRSKIEEENRKAMRTELNVREL